MEDIFEGKAKLDDLIKELQKKNPKKRFEDLKREECLQVYETVIQNAKEHLEISDLLANNKKYGSAITHAILASEEMTKAFILFVNGKGIRLNNTKGFVSFFYGHQPRHKLANFMTLLYLFFKPFSEILKIVQEKGLEINEEQIKKVLDINESMFKDSFTGIDWWLSADNLKNRGLYVDYNNQILRPNDLNADDFKTSIKVVMSYIMQVNGIIDNIQKIPENDFEKIIVFSKTQRFEFFLSTIFSSCIMKY